MAGELSRAPDLERRTVEQIGTVRETEAPGAIGAHEISELATRYLYPVRGQELREGGGVRPGVPAEEQHRQVSRRDRASSEHLSHRRIRNRSAQLAVGVEERPSGLVFGHRL